jgi:hypothetical protein
MDRNLTTDTPIVETLLVTASACLEITARLQARANIAVVDPSKGPPLIALMLDLLARLDADDPEL